MACDTTNKNGRTVAMATNQWTEDDDEDFEVDNAHTSDNDLVKQLRKAMRAKEKENKDLSEKFEALNKMQRERIVKEVLESKGVNAKAARLIMKDLDDVNEETVSHWLDDNGDLFGYNKQAEADPKQQLDLAALRQQDIVSQQGMTPDKQMDAMERINNASQDELIAMIQSGNF